MQVGDTSLGGRPKAFPETTWSMVARLQDLSAERRQAGLEELCRRYWKPVYCYLRAAWSRSNDDAKDITQSFFAWLAEGEPLRRFAPERGGFRAFLKLVLNGFVSNELKARTSLKRGGGRVLSLDDAAFAAAEVAVDKSETDPGRAFDRAWVAEILARAIARVGERCKESGRETPFRVYEEYVLAGQEPRPTYVQLGTKHGIPERAVEMHLESVRGWIREQVRAELQELTGDDKELDEEWSGFFGIGGPDRPRA